ncbi:MAG TPA: hypothetical protein VMK13_09645 [Streptosporangiaceae bacterium]|nr:hypothetical protein [Streptosporangiaceae bacterium]
MHFEAVGVSGANQYKVNPLAVVSTVPMLVLAVLMPAPEMVELELGLAAAEALGLLDAAELVEDVLPQAARITVTAARLAAAHHRFCMEFSPGSRDLPWRMSSTT